MPKLTKTESQRIKELRELMGLGVREMARELKCSPSTICYWEKGTRTPNMMAYYKMIDLAAKKGVEVDIYWLRPMPESLTA